VLGKVIIDATGDADIAAKAGVPYRVGRDESTETPDGRTQSMTLMFTISGFTKPPDREMKRKINELAEKAKKEGSLRLTHKGVGGWLLPRSGQYQLNAIHIDGNPLKIEELTYAEIESRKQARSIVNFYKKNVPGFENCFLFSTAFEIGIRDSRRIVGEYVLSWKNDVLPGRTHYDDICMGNDHEDIHGPGEGHGTHGRQIPVPPYGIPYRCLLPKNVDNLLVAGRCLSADWRAQSSARVMPTCFNMGQAAGTAAALAVKNNITPREVEVATLRKILREQGAIIFDKVPERIKQRYLRNPYA